MPHASVDAPFIPPARLQPVEHQDPYKPCWCGSGKKWKWCHKDREREKPVKIWEIVESHRAGFGKGYCSHPAAGEKTCGAKIVQAHTVQKRVGLAGIAEEGHVISVHKGAEDLFKNKGKFVPGRIGVNSATTFPGFCDIHDSEMFRSVETGEPTLNQEAAFLLSFRTIALELFQKRAQLESFSFKREMDKGKPFRVQAAMQMWLNDNLAGVKMGIVDTEAWKASYDAMFNAHKLSDFRFYGVVFDRILPVVSSGAFQPEWSFAGERLQRLGRGGEALQHIVFNLTVLNDRSVVVLGWTPESDIVAQAFARSFAEISDDQKADAAVRLAFEHVGNTCMRASWWQALDDGLRAEALKRIMAGLPTEEKDRGAEGLQPAKSSFVEAAVEQIETAWPPAQ